MKFRKPITLVVIAIAGFVADRFLKYLALHEVTFGPPSGGIRFELFPNPDIAFSLAVPSAWTLWLIPPVLLVFVWLGVRWYRRKDITRAAAAFLVVVASTSNYLDRIQHGYVVDYISFGEWFPVFNLSDVLIVIGLVLLVVRLDDRKPVA